MIRRGYLGGTFDPIHVGHLDVARAARRALALHDVVLLPAHVPPHRSMPHASAPHRFAMAALAAHGDASLLLSDLELEEVGPSYTSGTLDRLAAQGIDTRGVVFVTGADAFREIATWKDYPALLDRCHFAVVSRPDCPAPSLRTTLPSLAARMIDAPAGGPCEIPAQPSIFLIDAPTAAVSSTEVRRRVRAAESIAGLVPDAVEAYIQKEGLYKERNGQI